jgi:AcrR family transcriptional regulator
VSAKRASQVSAPARGRPRSAEPSRRIEEAAIELFFRKGFMGTTVREIMDACGQTPGALYNHFTSKDQLLYSLISAGHDRLNDVLDEALASARDDPRDQLWSLARAFALNHTGARREATVTNQEYQHLPDPERKRIVAQRRHVRGMFKDVIDRGVKLGLFELPTVDGQTNSTIVTMSILEMMVRVFEWFRPNGAYSAEQIAELHADLVMRLVDAKPGAKRRAKK